MKKYIIKDILNKTTKERRTDGNYPNRIGCTMKLINGNKGMPTLLEYLSDPNGKEISTKFLYTSPIESIVLNNGFIEVVTENSIYKLQVIYDKNN